MAIAEVIKNIVKDQIEKVHSGSSTEIIIKDYIAEEELKEIFRLTQLTRLDLSNLKKTETR